MSKNLEKALTEGKRLFLLYGQEKYLLEISLNKIIHHFLKPEEKDFNLEIMENLPKDMAELVNKCNTLPFMAEYRVMVLKTTGLFEHKDKKAMDQLAGELQKLPETTVLVVVEDTADKRKKLYKCFQTDGYIEEQKYLSEEQIAQLLIKRFDRQGLKIKLDAVGLLIQRTGTELFKLLNECEKLSSYAEEVITGEMVIKLVPERLESRIFRLTDALGQKDRQEAVYNYQVMLQNKESANYILYMIDRQILQLYQTKLLAAERMPLAEIEKILGVSNYVVKKLIAQAKLFSRKELERFLKDLANLEWDFKRGRVDLETGLEMLIISFSGANDGF
ncbi:DNA polymerase III subunit delta [Clostridiales bacterium COT073_COT-073]|nr:DNA polymerase III subunit delta [Clostridiales bacterium COT073_COT-073]